MLVDASSSPRSADRGALWSRRALLASLAALVADPAHGAPTARRWSRRSPYNQVEVVTHPDGQVELLLDGSRQSAWYPADPDRPVYGYTAAQLDSVARTPMARTGSGRALVIGLGGGTICRAIGRRWPDVDVQAVELDPVVVRAARRFFDLDRQVQVHVGDGRAFLDHAPGPWDLVLLDAASEDYVPPELQSLQCLRRVSDVLSPEGVVLANAWRGAPDAAREAATWRAVFPDVTERAVGAGEENRLFAAGPGWVPGPADVAVGATGARWLQD